jgi:uncharacterized OsmC-like protein
MGNKTFSAELKRAGVKKHNITIGNNESLDVVPPPAMADNPNTTSPHQLFLASIGACINLVFEIAMEKARLEVIDIKSHVTGDYETDEETAKSAFTAVNIDTHVYVPEGVKEERLQKLFEVAVNNCPIGNCLVGSCVKLNEHLTVHHQ